MQILAIRKCFFCLLTLFLLLCVQFLWPSSAEEDIQQVEDEVSPYAVSAPLSSNSNDELYDRLPKADVYYNSYHLPLPFAKTLNKIGLGKLFPMVHGAVMFKGEGWQEGGTEFHYAGDGWDRMHLEVASPAKVNSRYLYKSKHMGKTMMPAQDVLALVQNLGERKYNEQTYHATKHNCNHFCKDLIQQTTGNKMPNRFNRFARTMGHALRLDKFPAGKAGSLGRYFRSKFRNSKQKTP